MKNTKKAPRLIGAAAARKLCKQGYPIAAVADLWRANKNRLGLRDCRNIVESWGFLSGTSESVKGAKG